MGVHYSGHGLLSYLENLTDPQSFIFVGLKQLMMGLLSAIHLFIQILTVAGWGLFGQCFRKFEVKIFNWEKDERVTERVSGGMSKIYFPAIPATQSSTPEKKANSVYEDKMILDTSNSDSIYHPADCLDKRIPKLMKKLRKIVRLGIGSEDIFVHTITDCDAPFRAGKVGTGPYSRLMEAVKKLELTIQRKKYTTLRSGVSVDDTGYSFADHAKWNSENDHMTQKYQNAWSVNGNLSDGEKSMRVKILLLSYSIPTSRADPNVYRIKIGQLSFPVLGDQFDFVAVDTIAVNPVVFGDNNDISILFDTSLEGKPRVGFKVLKS